MMQHKLLNNKVHIYNINNHLHIQIIHPLLIFKITLSISIMSMGYCINIIFIHFGVWHNLKEYK